MRIENLRTEDRNDNKRVSASVIWEDCDKPQQEIYFETHNEFAESLWCNPHAFIAGCIMPALRHGENRVFIDAEICPEFRENLATALWLIHSWYYREEKKMVQIEAKIQSCLPTARKPERAGLFFSGGIDSLAIMRANRLNYPLEHTLSIRDGLFIYGQNIESDNSVITYQKAFKSLSKVAEDAGILLLPVFTNIRYLNTNGLFFKKEFHGAILAAVAHAFSKRFSVVNISSSDDIPSLLLQKVQNFKPWGSHPMIDTNYSSTDLRIRHVGLTLSRLDKVKLLADWDVAIQNIKVCGPNYPGDNCGKCEKCIRTQLALLAVGLLDKTKAFPFNDLSEEFIKTASIESPRLEHFTITHKYLELIPHLSSLGRHDLVRGIEHIVARARKDDSIWRAKVKRFDSKYLNGALVKLKNMFYSLQHIQICN